MVLLSGKELELRGGMMTEEGAVGSDTGAESGIPQGKQPLLDSQGSPLKFYQRRNFKIGMGAMVGVLALCALGLALEGTHTTNATGWFDDEHKS